MILLTMDASRIHGKNRIKVGLERNEAPFWGHVEYDNNLLVKKADSIARLQSKVQTLLKDFHELDTNAYKLQIQFV